MHLYHAVHIEPQATQDDLRNVVPDFAVEKTPGGTTAVTKQDGDQFSNLQLNACSCYFPVFAVANTSVVVCL